MSLRNFVDYGPLARMAYVMAMRIMQSSMYRDLDDEEKVAVDDAIENYIGRSPGRNT